MRTRGFTIVELVIVIILIAVLAAVALPRFFAGTNQARLAHALTTTGAFGEAITSYHAAWRAQGRPGSLNLDGKNVSFVNGWPHPVFQNIASCTDLWDTAFRGAEPLQPYVAGAPAPAWSVLAFGTICLYVYHDGEIYSGANLLPFFWYRPFNGAPQIRKFNMS